VLAAAALRCIGGQMQGRCSSTPTSRSRAPQGWASPTRNKVYRMDEMASGDVVFAATGVTDGNLLAGVKFGRSAIQTHTIVMRSSSRTVREIKARHQDLDKF
jgi:fructose-1,6-bisphosphatase II / sedoheptulose-1,7-bisphosphatase